jgi:carbamoyl-phosphate synthase large subunit
MDLMNEHGVEWVVNTIDMGSDPAVDESRMRSQTILRGIPITTTLNGLEAALCGLEFRERHNRLDICSLQEYNRHQQRLVLPHSSGGGRLRNLPGV